MYLAGHKNASTTDCYIHPAQEAAEAVIKARKR